MGINVYGQFPGFLDRVFFYSVMALYNNPHWEAAMLHGLTARSWSTAPFMVAFPVLQLSDGSGQVFPYKMFFGVKSPQTAVKGVFFDKSVIFTPLTCNFGIKVSLERINDN